MGTVYIPSPDQTAVDQIQAAVTAGFRSTAQITSYVATYACDDVVEKYYKPVTIAPPDTVRITNLDA